MTYYCQRCQTGTDNTKKTNACYCTTYFKDEGTPPPLYWTKDDFEEFTVVEITSYQIKAHDQEHAQKIVESDEFYPNNPRVVTDSHTIKVLTPTEWRMIVKAFYDILRS